MKSPGLSYCGFSLLFQETMSLFSDYEKKKKQTCCWSECNFLEEGFDFTVFKSVFSNADSG